MSFVSILYILVIITLYRFLTLYIQAPCLQYLLPQICPLECYIFTFPENCMEYLTALSVKTLQLIPGVDRIKSIFLNWTLKAFHNLTSAHLFNLIIQAFRNTHGTSLVVQWLRFHAPNAGGLGSVPEWGTRSNMQQLRPSVAK